MARNAFYAQSGGVTAVINASAAGVIETARKHRKHIGKVYAGKNGILGALDEELIDTSKESPAAIRALKLSADQLDALEDRLPPKGSGGATGQRVDECYRFLDRLQAARA